MNEIVNCFSVIHMLKMSAISLEACAGARATIRAAEIQAKAARSAGTETLVAGILALLASLIAAGVTYFVARSESIRAKREQEIIRKAYTTALHALLYNVRIEASALSDFLLKLSQQRKLRANDGGLIRPDLLDLHYHQSARDALALERWADLSKLPDTAIKHAVASGIAVNYNIQIYSSIESFLQYEDKHPGSEDYSQIKSLSLHYETRVKENKDVINTLYELLGERDKRPKKAPTSSSSALTQPSPSQQPTQPISVPPQFPE